ncbi:TPM domain-containing protein [Micrococcus terreus]|uniref:TPM domain-containing protein n=1 Tax=Micrococcus terreus TaxID=574650 RepID=UPI0023F6F30E|nr:TPM domain-containing protein [Micrococcus terreus]
MTATSHSWQPVRLSPAVLTAGALVGSAVTVGAGLTMASSAQAAAPVEIPPGVFVVDEAQVLTALEETQLEEEIAQLRREEGQSLFVVYVDGTNAPLDQWITAVARQKGLSQSDSMMVIDVAERQVRYAAHDANSIEVFEDDIIQDYVFPALPARGEDDWAAAGSAAVEGVLAASTGALGSGSGSGANDGGASREQTGSGDTGAGGWVAGGLVTAALVGGGVALASRKKKGKDSSRGRSVESAQGPQDPLDAMSVEDLRNKAGSMLVAADDAIKSSEQELGFAMAAYGDDSVTTFRSDIEAAKAHMMESFKLQHQLDDHIPDTEEQQRAWLKDIIARCEAVGASLSEHQQEFNELRDLEKNAPAALTALEQRAGELAQPVNEAERRLVDLHARYADSALVEVNDNASDARERLEFISSAVAKARQSLEASDLSTAALAIRAGEEAAAQVTTLVEAVGKASDHLDRTMQNVTTGVRQTAQDLAQAQALVNAGQHPELAGPIAGVEQALRSVQTGMASGKPDPIDLLHDLENAHRQLDAQLGGIRDQQEQSRRAAAQLQQAILQAQAQIDGTQDYIAARRGAVGSQARTKLAEADRTLQQAVQLSGSDPVTALNMAQQAGALAERASRMAQQDLDDWGGYGGGGFGGGGYTRRGGGGFGGSFGGGLGGAILGGILIDSVLGGRSDHSDWGGGGFGGFGGGGLGGGDFGGFGDIAGGSF